LFCALYFNIFWSGGIASLRIAFTGAAAVLSGAERGSPPPVPPARRSSHQLPGPPASHAAYKRLRGEAVGQQAGAAISTGLPVTHSRLSCLNPFTHNFLPRPDKTATDNFSAGNLLSLAIY